MSDDIEKTEKGRNLLAYWLFGTVLIVFAAITAYVTLISRPIGATMMDVMKIGFPIWGVTALAAIIIYVAYYFYTKDKA